jgi:phosphoglycolate phosphatase
MKQSTSPMSAQTFNIKAILIDLDGTLVDSAPEIAKAACKMLEQLNLPMLSQDQVQSYIGEGAAALIKRCLTEALQKAPDQPLFDQGFQLFFQQYALICTESQLYPKVLESVKAMKALGLPLACVTNKPSVFTLPILKATGVFEYFDQIISGDTLPKKKPDPDQIFHVCQLFKVDPWETLLIGDSNTDILAAKNAGCYVFTVPYGYNQGMTIDDSAVDAMIQDLSEVTNYIQT